MLLSQIAINELRNTTSTCKNIHIQQPLVTGSV